MLKIEHLTKTYPNGKKAVDDLSLTIQAGDIYGFIGANGRSNPWIPTTAFIVEVFPAL